MSVRGCELVLIGTLNTDVVAVRTHFCFCVVRNGITSPVVPSLHC